MKKIVINIIVILLIFAILCAVILNFNKKDKDDGLKTIRVADATITLWKYNFKINHY